MMKITISKIPPLQGEEKTFYVTRVKKANKLHRNGGGNAKHEKYPKKNKIKQMA